MTFFHVEFTPEELEAFETLMAENGSKSHSDFLRVCVNAYAGKEILTRRYKGIRLTNQKWQDSWNFAGGKVVIDTNDSRIKVYFHEKPDIETRLNLRMLHFVPKEGVCVWTRIIEKYAIPKVRALLKPI